MGGRGVRSRSYTGFARGALHGGISESCEPGVAICRSGGDFPCAVLGDRGFRAAHDRLAVLGRVCFPPAPGRLTSASGHVLRRLFSSDDGGRGAAKEEFRTPEIRTARRVSGITPLFGSARQLWSVVQEAGSPALGNVDRRGCWRFSRSSPAPSLSGKVKPACGIMASMGEGSQVTKVIGGGLAWVARRQAQAALTAGQGRRGLRRTRSRWRASEPRESALSLACRSRYLRSTVTVRRSPS